MSPGVFMNSIFWSSNPNCCKTKIRLPPFPKSKIFDSVIEVEENPKERVATPFERPVGTSFVDMLGSKAKQENVKDLVWIYHYKYIEWLSTIIYSLLISCFLLTISDKILLVLFFIK